MEGETEDSETANAGEEALGSLRSKEVMFRADKVDFKNWEIQLERHLRRIWSKNTGSFTSRKEEWEIDLSKFCQLNHFYI